MARVEHRERIRLSIWMARSMNSLKLFPSSQQASYDCSSRFSPLRNKSFSVSSTHVVSTYSEGRCKPSNYVKYRQGRTAGDRQGQGRVPGRGSGQAASKHSSGEMIRGRGRQKTIRITGNGPRSSTQKSNTGITLRKDSQGKSRL